MAIDEVEEVFKKYKNVEDEINKLLNQEELRNIPKPEINMSKKLQLSKEEAVIRNNHILKDLETVKGNLRSKSIFSPMELQWEHVCLNYRKNPSLPVTTWHCHSPVFV